MNPEEGLPPASKTPKRAALLIHFALLLLALYQTAITISHYLANTLYTHDVGHIFYAFDYTLRGQFFWSIVRDCPHFAIHFTPTLLALLPLHVVFRHVLFLPLAETWAVMSCAWAMAWMMSGFQRLGGAKAPALSPLGLALGWLFVASPLAGSLMMADHFESFAVALSLWALGALANGRRRLFWTLMLLALGVKEDMALYWGTFGVWWILFGWGVADQPRIGRDLSWRRRLRLGLPIAVVCGAWMIVALITIRWTALQWGRPASEFAYRYDWMGATISERLATFFTTPKAMILPLTQTLGILLWPALLLPLLAPGTLLLLIPGAYLMGLSQGEPQHRLLYYYSYPFLPFLFLGAGLGLARLMRWTEKRHWAKRQAMPLLMLLAGAAMLFAPLRGHETRRVPARPTARHAAIRAALAEAIPRDASVVAQYDLLCQVPPVPEMYPLSEANLGKAQYIVLDPRGEYGDVGPEEYRNILRIINQLAAQGRIQIITNNNPPGLIIAR